MSGFLLLRRVGIAVVLCAFNIVLRLQCHQPDIDRCGTRTDMFIGVGVPVGAVLLSFCQRIVHDKQWVTLREQVTTEP